MKRSLIISAIILVLGAIIGWPELRRLSREQDSHEKLRSEAAKPGNTDADGNAKEQMSRSRQRERSEIGEEGKALAQELIAYYRNPKSSNSNYRELYTRVQKLSLSQFKGFVAEFCDIANRDGAELENLEDMIESYSEKYPIEMAQMLSKSPEIMNHDTAVISSAFFSLIYNWAVDKNNPAAAFQFLAAAEPSFQSDFIDVIVRAALSSERRTETLAAMRAFATTQEQRELAYGQMNVLTFGEGHVKLGYDEVTAWISSANLSSEELAGATKGMQKQVRVGETAQWLDWLAKSEVFDEIAKERAFELATQWTEKDYQAVGTWLNSAPDSPEKAAVAGAYAAKAYPYDPQNAMQWIRTIPQGPDRTKALETIYQSMPKDSDTAKAFANENGLNR